MKGTTHQKWNHPKIIILLGTINKSRQKTNFTKLITAGNTMLLK
jgi:hypothetical protein